MAARAVDPGGTMVVQAGRYGEIKLRRLNTGELIPGVPPRSYTQAERKAYLRAARQGKAALRALLAQWAAARHKPSP
jgi:hypothetical protein